MSTRKGRAETARETLEILETGTYRSPAGRPVEISEALDSAVGESRLYSPQQFPEVNAARDERLAAAPCPRPIRIEVINATTLAAGRRLVEEQHQEDVLLLNFASAKHPGGGFLSGAQAQEESLARASGLYACLAPLEAMYETNKRYRSSLYTDHMIYSPQVPVFRDDEDRLLETPWLASMLTAPAVNAGSIQSNEPENIPRIQETMLRRMEKLLSVAVVHKHSALVLGAWGCGVFRNDPADVARWFHFHLIENETFRHAFDTVIFAVLDTSQDQKTLRAFQQQFS